MADAVTSQTIIDSGRNVVMHFTNISDGVGEAAVVKVDASTLDKIGFTKEDITDLAIVKIIYSCVGMGVRLLWGATADVLAVELPANEAGELDYSKVGGLLNNAGAGKNGDVKFTTIGHAAGDSYSIRLVLRKS